MRACESCGEMRQRRRCEHCGPHGMPLVRRLVRFVAIEVSRAYFMQRPCQLAALLEPRTPVRIPHDQSRRFPRFSRVFTWHDACII